MRQMVFCAGLCAGLAVLPAAAKDDSQLRRTDSHVPSRPVPGTHDCADFYPSASQLTNESGDVLISYDVDSAGHIGNVRVVKSSGHALLDRAAVECVTRHWRNTAAMEGTRPVASPGHQAIIRFMLAGNTNQPVSRALPPAEPAASPAPEEDTGNEDLAEFLLWTLGPLAVLAWIVRWSRLWIFRRRDCTACGARNRSIVPFTRPGYCSHCGTKFAPAD